MNIEPLESRIAPAATFVYTDIDGDRVTIKTSKGTNADLEAAGVLIFSDPDAADPRQLRKIDFSLNAAVFEGTNLSITVKRGPGNGDGLANVGWIDARNLDGSGSSLRLGVIKIAGDLGQIEASSLGAAVPAVKSLTVRSMGRLGLATQPAGGDLESDIFGDIGSLKVNGDFAGAFLRASDIGKLTITGSIIGGDADDSGRILLSNAGMVKIGGSIVGDEGLNSGRISAVGEMKSLSIGGSLIGGSSNSSGSIAAGQMGVLKIAHDVLGGTEAFTGHIFFQSATSIKVGGSVVGGTSAASGDIGCVGLIGSVSIAGDLVAGTLGSTGLLEAKGFGSVTVGGSLLGGQFEHDPGIMCGAIIAGIDGIAGVVKIGHDVRGANAIGGGSADLTGAISSEGRIGSVIIGGSLITGTDASPGVYRRSGGIFAGDDIGSITIRGSVIGHDGPGSTPAVIAARGQANPGANGDVAIGKITIGGSVERAQILAGYDETLAPLNADAQIGAVNVGGDWVASSIAAGSINLGNDDVVGGVGDNADNVNFGNPHDVKISEVSDVLTSKIASITIRGQIFGTESPILDRFGFVAEEISAFKVGGLKVSLLAQPFNDGFIVIGSFNDVRIHELLAS
jgi:hypothetical protein